VGEKEKGVNRVVCSGRRMIRGGGHQLGEPLAISHDRTYSGGSTGTSPGERGTKSLSLLRGGKKWPRRMGGSNIYLPSAHSDKGTVCNADPRTEEQEIEEVEGSMVI